MWISTIPLTIDNKKPPGTGPGGSNSIVCSALVGELDVGGLLAAAAAVILDLEGDLVAMTDPRVPQLPLDRVEGMDTRTGEPSADGHRVALSHVLIKGHLGALRGVVHRPQPLLRSAVAIPTGTQLIDARGKTIMPGMVDDHFHGGEQGLQLDAFLQGRGFADKIREQISGNYCRCTGYHAIVDAIEAVAEARGGKR
mgnify:CR=1 FL=1